MKKFLRNYILLSILANAFFANAQTTSPRLRAVRQRLGGALTEYYKKYPQEKIFLHTDQNVYLGGQTIWYKAYAMAYGKPSQLSGIMYVRLSDSNGKRIIQDKLLLKNSTAYSNITLPDSLPTGWYNVQAFTAWMINFDKGAIYHENIYIQNIRNPAGRAMVSNPAKACHINFFPEGGDLVDGNLHNVAFKATDENGLPVKVEGEIMDNNQNGVAKLITVHDGMGSFDLEADATKTYTAQARFADGSLQQIALPPVKKTGLSLSVNTTAANSLQVKIACNYPSEEHKDVLIVAEQGNGTSVLYPLRLRRGINPVNLNANNFSTGIVRLTVFDDTGLPLAERVAFINNNDQLQLALTSGKLSFVPKGENEFTLSVKDKDGQTVKANFSVAVTDVGVGVEPDDNICSYLLMSSELRGYIHQPAYYFKNNSDTLRQQLDLVMLTSGWRHFKWDTLLNNKAVKLNYFVENTQIIAGKIENYQDKDNLRIKLLITNSDSTKNVVSVRPASNGIFALTGYDRQGTATVSYEVVNKKNIRKPAKVTFFTPVADTIHLATETSAGLSEITRSFNKTHMDSLATAQKSMVIEKGTMLKTVNIKEQPLTPTELLIQNHVKQLKADNATTFDLVNNPTPAVGPMDGGILAYLQGRIPGLQMFKKVDGSWHFEYNGESSAVGEAQPAYYIDEANVNLSDLIEVPMTDIALVRFAPPPVWFAPGNGGFIGAILVYTKRFGDEKSSYTNGKDFGQYTYSSFSVTREFPSPDYSNAKQKSQPDYRTTLFWAHDLNTDDYGKVKIHFYNSDKAKRYRIIIQAMDADGRVGFLDEVL